MVSLPVCSYGLDIETTCHYLLHCPNFTNERSTLLNIVSRINKNSLTSCYATITKPLLYGEESLDLVTNILKINASFDGLTILLFVICCVVKNIAKYLDNLLRFTFSIFFYIVCSIFNFIFLFSVYSQVHMFLR